MAQTVYQTPGMARLMADVRCGISALDAAVEGLREIAQVHPHTTQAAIARDATDEVRDILQGVKGSVVKFIELPPERFDGSEDRLKHAIGPRR